MILILYIKPRCSNQYNSISALYKELISYETKEPFEFLCLSYEELINISNELRKENKNYYKQRITTTFLKDSSGCYRTLNRQIRDEYFYHLQNTDTSMIIPINRGKEVL